MIKVFFSSDSYERTGPSIVNSYYRKLLGDHYTFMPQGLTKWKRFWFGIKSVIKHDVLIISGASWGDMINIIIGKIFRKKIIYIMHGCIREENKINHVENKKEELLENMYLMSVDMILCVSEKFTEWLKIKRPEYTKKIFTLTNGVDWKIISDFNTQVCNRDNAISIIGGGVPRKNVKDVCKAVEKINKEYNLSLKLKVFGRDDIDTLEIKKYNNVEYFGKIDRKLLFKEISSTKLFVQNSVFDTFAMAPLEALMCGCDILCSQYIGALSLFENLEPEDVILNCYDIDEIKEKIISLLKKGNHDRLITGLNKEKTSFEYRANQLENYVKRIMLK